jgi:dipeptidyl aminopeptidase/acylaminoacyl peptidase
MKRRWITALAAFAALSLAACDGGNVDQAQPSGPASTGPTEDTPGSIGRIVFNRGEPGTGNAVTYTINPDGSAEQQLFLEGGSENARWSPDGTEIHIFCCSDGMVAHFLDPSTGELRVLEPSDPAIELFCGGAWTPDGERVACEGYGVEDPSRNGIYWVRSSDGGGLEQITSNPDGEDIPNGDFSPEGDRLVFVRVGDNGQAGIFTVDVDGSGLRRISGRDQLVDDIFGGSWSPDGSQILFVARETPEHHKEIWVVNADGSSRHQLRIEGTCGGPLSDPGSFGCYSPGWSPDGTKIVFVRSTSDPSAPAGFYENVYTVNADGSDLFQVTNGGVDDNPDWGSPPPTA